MPIGASKTALKYEVYRNKNSSEEDFQEVNQLYKTILSDDKYLCDLTQKNLNQHVFTNGEMHPDLEKGPLYFQAILRDEVMKHYKREQTLRREIWPAAPPPVQDASTSEEDVEFCSGLACSPAQQQQIVW